MNNFIKLTALIIPFTMMVGCATTSEMEEMKASVATAQSAADSALSTAKQAQSTANAAQQTAESAAQTANNANKTADRALNAVDAQNIKINRMFEKSMSK